jgi:hypothetical protein
MKQGLSIKHGKESKQLQTKFITKTISMQRLLMQTLFQVNNLKISIFNAKPNLMLYMELMTPLMKIGKRPILNAETMNSRDCSQTALPIKEPLVLLSENGQLTTMFKFSTKVLILFQLLMKKELLEESFMSLL